MVKAHRATELVRRLMRLVGLAVGEVRLSNRERGLLSNRGRHVMLRIGFRHPQYHQLTRTVSLLPSLIITAEFSVSPRALTIIFIAWKSLENVQKAYKGH